MLVASVDENDPLRLADFEERQWLKDFEDRLIDILLIFDATYDTITSILDRYHKFRISCDSTWYDRNDVESDFIVCALQERQKDVLSSRNKIKMLHKKVQGTTNLVSKNSLNYQVGNTLIDILLAVESLGPKQRILTQTAGRGGKKRKYHNAATHREKHKRCSNSQGTYNHYAYIPSCYSRIGERVPGLHGILCVKTDESLEFLFNAIC